jgi:hypothetical protein
MKTQLGTYLKFKRKFRFQSLIPSAGNSTMLSGSLFLFIATLLPGCSKQQPDTPAKQPVVKTEVTSLNSDDEFIAAYDSISYNNTNSTMGNNQGEAKSRFSCAFPELLEARAATAKYRDFDKAVADSFVDINVVVPNMGYHFMKSSIVDAKFEIRKPEILVYNKKLNGKFELVAVEYAVPISATPDKAPEGFTGSADVWERNTVFGLWLQHAWIWKFNPAGVFHDTNPRVTVR